MFKKPSKACVAINLPVRWFRSYIEKAFVNNSWVCSKSGDAFSVKNPWTGRVMGKVPDMDIEDVQDAIQVACGAFALWKTTTGKERSSFLTKWHHLFQKNAENFSKLLCEEAGKPLKEARAEVRYGSAFVEFYAEEAKRMHGEILSSPAKNKKLFMEREPIGPVGLITAWNFPFALLARKASAALAAGCTCVIKPSEEAPFTSLAMMELALEAGFPEGVLNVVTCDRRNASRVVAFLCESENIAGISFTGSTQVGKILYKLCASGVKRVGLELSGNAPFIVYASADMEKAIDGAISSKFRNCGQTCVASNRFFVQWDKFEEFSHRLTDRVRSLRMGDAQDDRVDVGPLINHRQFERVSAMVDDAISKGARLLLGGKNAPKYGPLFYEPTILTDVNEHMAVYKEEVFGPVVCLACFECEEDSIRMANSTPYGLASYVFSEDLAQIFRVTKQLEAGMCGVNEGLISMAEIPFGGIKESGIGREGSKYGLDDFTYMKYVCIGGLGKNYI